jgi:hypothetical protein
VIFPNNFNLDCVGIEAAATGPLDGQAEETSFFKNLFNCDVDKLSLRLQMELTVI